ncbi:aldo/keto reductase [Sphingomonas piscis]|uniref:Aldo/keto reductase n=1 Tax=Sphingomonas piscis TaxID=2714943 RepID=A0A6G7YNN2_9SPHN|nr:aldo/keto reductase [Sphingomonas piscis]QIK78353.1 aldo/keto reductase [Sphingomonas piscis]
MTLRLPPYGVGTAELGNLYTPISDAEAQATIEAAWECGYRYFDTAPYYGFGLSEQRLGTALSVIDPGQAAIVSTKVGRILDPVASPARERHGFVDAAPFEPRFDYSGEAILQSHEESLGRLQRDRINILLVHDIGELTHGAASDQHLRTFLESGYPALAKLRDTGVVDMIGLGVNETEVCDFLLDRIDLDVILLAGRLTLLDQRALTSVLPKCEQQGVQFIAAAPFNSGILARSAAEAASAHYDYKRPSAQLVDKATAIERVCARFGVVLPAAAMQFPNRHSAVSCVLAGMATPSEVKENHQRSTADLPDELWGALRAEGLIDLPLARRDA